MERVRERRDRHKEIKKMFVMKNRRIPQSVAYCG